MKNVRKGNDILFRWSIFDADGNPYDHLDRLNFVITLSTPFGQMCPIRDMTISENVITFYFRGKDQTCLGKHVLMFVENGGEDGMHVIDILDAVNIVEHTYQVGGEDTCSRLRSETIQLTSETSFGIPGPRGYSIYDLAVKYHAFVGTEEEFVTWFRTGVDNAYAAANLANDKAALVQQRLDTADADHTRAENDHTRADTDHRTALSDHDTAGADHLRAEQDHSRAEQDHTREGQDHSVALADHAQYLTDHTIVQGYENRLHALETEHIVISESEWEQLENPDPNKIYMIYEDED